MRNGDLLNSIKNVVKGGLPTHRVGEYDDNISKVRTGSHSGGQLDIEHEIISCAIGAAFESIFTTRLYAFIDQRRDRALKSEVLTVPYAFARHMMCLDRQFKRPSDFMRIAQGTAAAEINAAACPFLVTVSLVRDGSAVVGVSFALESREHANFDDAEAAS